MLTIGQVVDCIESTFGNLIMTYNYNTIYLQNLVIPWRFSLNCSTKKKKLAITIPMRQTKFSQNRYIAFLSPLTNVRM